MTLSYNKIILTTLFNLLLITNLAFAQESPGLGWKRNFGGKKAEKGYDITPTYEGKIALIGSTNSTPAQGTDALFMILDETGKEEVTKIIGSEKDDELTCIANTLDGGFLLSGHTKNTKTGHRDGWLLQLDEKGDTLWQKILGGPQNDAFTGAVQTADGGLIAAGYFGMTEGKRALWIYRAYEDGNIRWQKTFGGKTQDEARAIIETREGNFAIAGTTKSGKGNQNIWLFLIDKEGKPLHYQIFGSRQFEEVYDLIELKDGGFAMTGYAKTNKQNKGNGLKDMWVIKTNAKGEMVWERTFGGKSNDSAYGITETTDGGLVLVGYTFSHLMGANTSKAAIIKCDKDGELVWEMPARGGKGMDEVRAVCLMPSGGVAMIGTTNSKSENAQKNDLWVMNFAPDFTVNTLIPTQLVIQSAKLKDNGDRIVEEGETAYFELVIENKGRQDAVDVNLIVLDKTEIKGLVYKNFRKISILKSGRSEKVFLPVSAIAGVESDEAQFEFFCTDASRTRSEVVELKVETKPLTIPSNYLKVVWSDPSPIDHDNLYKKVKTGRLPIRLKARSDQPLKRRYFTIFLNGEPYKVGQKAGEAKLLSKGNKKGVYDFDYQHFLDLKVGLNLVQVVVDNGTVQDSSAVFQIEYSIQPNLHILAIGIEHDDLQYTTKDAKDFAQTFENQEGKLFDKIFLTTLTSGSRTAAGVFQTEGEVIKTAFENLQESYQYTIYEQDLLIVFMSSHGKTINNKFKVVPTDFEIMGESVLIDYKSDIIQPLENLPCHKLLLIDACHSGSYALDERVGATIQEEEQAKAILELSETLQTTNTMASCQANESSWEDDQWENGAFTEALIGAFKNESYKDANGEFKVSSDNAIITIEELYRYLQRRVPQMILDIGKKASQQPFLSEDQLKRVKDLPVFEVQ